MWEREEIEKAVPDVFAFYQLQDLEDTLDDVMVLLTSEKGEI